MYIDNLIERRRDATASSAVVTPDGTVAMTERVTLHVKSPLDLGDRRSASRPGASSGTRFSEPVPLELRMLAPHSGARAAFARRSGAARVPLGRRL